MTNSDLWVFSLFYIKVPLRVPVTGPIMFQILQILTENMHAPKESLQNKFYYLTHIQSTLQPLSPIQKKLAI